jgi:hypothetical protein
MISKTDERRKWKNVKTDEERKKTYRRPKNELKRATDNVKKEYLENTLTRLQNFKEQGVMN